LAKTSPTVTTLLNTPIPEVLWHYTSFSGLKGIVDSRNIFASDIRFLNDSQELIHAKFLLEEIADYEKKQLTEAASLNEIPPIVGNALRREIQWLFEAGPLHSNLLQVFVACFSGAKDQLSQWRGYSYGTSGVSIGFDLREIRSNLNRQLAVFAPCIYDDNEKRKLLREIIKELVERTAKLEELAYSAGLDAWNSKKYESHEKGFSDWFENSPECLELSQQIDHNRMSATYDLLHVAALMKHSSFSEEKEWRLAIPLLKGFNDHGASVFFGANAHSLVPRITLELDFDTTPVMEIVLGPGSHPYAIEALQRYMTSQNLKPEIAKSLAPYRSTG
jgi:Protein of unknown function (DUF2971)